MIDNISLVLGKMDDNSDQCSHARPSTIQSNRTDMQFKELEQIMKDCISENKPLIFPDTTAELEEYDDDDVNALIQRDFQTRIFMSSLSINMNCVWLRNHHYDNFNSKSNFTYVRDIFKAAFTTKNHTAAKSTLTSELTKWFDLDHHEYYTYATTLASALSEEATNTSFQIHPAMVGSSGQLPFARKTLILLMDILFSKVYLKTFLHKESNSNIYRLVHCVTKHTGSHSSLLYAVFSFLLQLALTTFVVLQVVAPSDENDKNRSGMIPNANEYMVLALFGAIYSIMITNKEYKIAKDVFKFYGKVGLLQMMDAFVNLVLPMILLVSGFIVTTQEDSYINAVLNTAAFLFIPEIGMVSDTEQNLQDMAFYLFERFLTTFPLAYLPIDDQLPALLGFDEEAIIENYLIAESKTDYNSFAALSEKEINKTFKKLDSHSALGVPFNDYYITNCTEQGSSPKDGSLYQPHMIVRNDRSGHEIDPSNYVTKDCLLKRIEWSYTTFNPKTTKPRVGYLKLFKLDGEIVEINYKGVEAMEVGERHCVEGVFVITNFVMSSGILKFRFCGSDSAKNFLKAFEYYSLWEIDRQARLQLLKHKNKKKKEKRGCLNQKVSSSADGENFV